MAKDQQTDAASTGPAPPAKLEGLRTPDNPVVQTDSKLFVTVEPLVGKRMDHVLKRQVDTTTNLNRVWVQTPERAKEGLSPFHFGTVSRVVKGSPINPATNIDPQFWPEILAAVDKLMPETAPHRLQPLQGQTAKNHAPTIEIPLHLLG